MSPIRGIFAPNIVPLDDQQRIAEPELRRYVDWLIDQGVHGLYPNGSTGEFTRFTAEERRRIIRIVTEQAAGRVLVLAGAAESDVRTTLAACETYRDFGATAVAIVAPYYYRLGADAVYAYFREIALESPIDIVLYNIPMFASPLDVKTVRKLADLERIVGIKDSSGDITNMLRLICAIRPGRPDFAFLTGCESTLVPMMLMGCDGGVNAVSCFVPDYLRRMYDLVQAGEMASARTMQFNLLELIDLIVYALEFPAAVRTAVGLRGFEVGSTRQPLGDVQQSAEPRVRKQIQEALEALGYRADATAFPSPVPIIADINGHNR